MADHRYPPSVCFVFISHLVYMIPCPQPQNYSKMQNCRHTGSALKRKSTNRPRTIKVPENAAVVKTSVEQSPRRSARKHTAALQLSNHSIQKILHEKFKMHPNKIKITRELSERQWETLTT